LFGASSKENIKETACLIRENDALIAKRKGQFSNKLEYAGEPVVM
jgi:hypothetical protein